jgi:hypothetical protein
MDIFAWERSGIKGRREGTGRFLRIWDGFGMGVI